MKKASFVLLAVVMFLVITMGVSCKKTNVKEETVVLIFAENNLPDLKYIGLSSEFFKGKSMPEIEYKIRKKTVGHGGNAFVITNSNHDTRGYLLSNVGDPRYFNPRNFLIRKFTLTGSVVLFDEDQETIDKKVDDWLNGLDPQASELEPEELVENSGEEKSSGK